MKKLDFYFDYSSPWTYLGFTGFLQIMQKHEIDLHWKPILVGGIFNTVNQTVYQNREKTNPIKERYYKKDLQDWCHYYGIQINWPDVFPVNSVKAMRGAFVALEQDCLIPYSLATFEAYWRDNKDISKDTVLHEIILSAGLSPDEFFGRISQDSYKQALRKNTDDLIALGGFGSPTFIIDEQDMYFGNDRLPLVRAALENA